MRFSIVIPTINRKDELLLMLLSLKEQTFKNFEVLVIDQNSNNLIELLVNRFKNDLSIKHIKAPALGASNARNVGIENAIGDILTFPDDDCEYPITLLEEISSYFNANKIDGITVPAKDKEFGKAIALLASKTQLVHKRNILSTAIEAGIFIKKNAINSYKFDTNLGVGSLSPYWSDEGPDFILKLLNEKRTIIYCPRFVIFHPNPVKVYSEKTTIRGYKYGLGRGYFLKKNKYGFHFILYYLLIYLIGMFKGVIFLDKHMFNYFKEGFRGRFEGYFLSK